MKRLHVNLAVSDLAQSVRFYSALFGAAPTVSKPDYAKWMLDDPRVNFALSNRSKRKGVDHLGIQVENPAELAEVYGRLRAAPGPTAELGDTTCCYARSEKAWSRDPDGVAWEAFLTHGESATFGSDDEPMAESAGACCPASSVAAQPAVAAQPDKGGSCC